MPKIDQSSYFILHSNHIKKTKYASNIKSIQVKNNIWIVYVVTVVCIIIIVAAVVAVFIYIWNKKCVINKSYSIGYKVALLNSEASDKSREQERCWFKFGLFTDVFSKFNFSKDIVYEVDEKKEGIVIKEVQPAVSKAQSYYLGNTNTLAFSPQSPGIVPTGQRNVGYRAKNKGLLESRRGSRTSLTLSLSPSIDSMSSTRSPSPLRTDVERDRFILENNSLYLTIDELKQKVHGDSEILFQEFWSIPMNHTSRCELNISGMVNKNRYKSILPNEQTRVVLPQINDNYLSTYINANYIRGYKDYSKRFIATQGPMPQTVVDFWRLVCHVQASAIVMLTKLTENNKRKCEYYLPNNDDNRDFYGDVCVCIESKEEMEGYVIRKLKIQYEDQTLNCNHFWFTLWPDLGSPSPETTTYILSLIDSLEFLNQSKPVSDPTSKSEPVKPVIVHCSAGLGRTGCFIALCTGCRQLRKEFGVDVFGIVSRMRLDRGGMINNNEQYEFIHRALLQYAQQYCLSSESEPQDRSSSIRKQTNSFSV